MIFSVSRGLSQDVVSCDCVGPQQSQAKPSTFVKFFRSDGGIASSRQVAAPLLKHRKGTATCSTRIAGQAEMGSSKHQLGLIEQCIHCIVSTRTKNSTLQLELISTHRIAVGQHI